MRAGDPGCLLVGGLGRTQGTHLVVDPVSSDFLYLGACP